MTNAEWKELVAKEFNVSKSVARDMVSAMYSVYRRKKDKINDPRYATKKSKLVVIDEEDYNTICEMSNREG